MLAINFSGPDSAPYLLHDGLIGFSCIRCNLDLPVADYFEGCPACRDLGEPSSVHAKFASRPSELTSPGGRGMARYASWLPYVRWISLGEGGTPCISVPSLADRLGTSTLYVKNEGQNPSGSHKDRVSCLTVTRALDVGASKLIAASSGNAGASLALYAAAAGLGCCIVATKALLAGHRRAITATGAELIYVEDALERWRLVADMAREQGFFPATNYLNPPVGSNHFGVEGLKTIAFEIVEDVGTDIGTVLVPTSRGDLLWGLYEGFRQMREAGLIETLPQLYVVEPFARVARVLSGDALSGSFPGSTSLFSIGGSTVTYQALEAVRASKGGAVVVDEAHVRDDYALLARAGFFLELSAAATLTGAASLLQDGMIDRTKPVVLMATSHGYKDLAGLEDEV